MISRMNHIRLFSSAKNTSTDTAKTTKTKGEKSTHDNAPGWKETHASQSEATTKADKSKNKSSEQMQNETIKNVHGQQKKEENKPKV
ncbi:unnamed protein product [Didymodactylos carnosus]|uniref:Uncharacterized protein n=2 Tax=Didymodactylos carnosus TaxID=1234261 RepID=A0A8S2EX20_9BILA|nr:unnamed protein product [Didymodactylos carnosus]CAF4149772.1 unnamed protein product [Didymodactylos carnosus]